MQQPARCEARRRTWDQRIADILRITVTTQSGSYATRAQVSFPHLRLVGLRSFDVRKCGSTDSLFYVATRPQPITGSLLPPKKIFATGHFFGSVAPRWTSEAGPRPPARAPYRRRRSYLRVVIGGADGHPSRTKTRFTGTTKGREKRGK